MKKDIENRNDIEHLVKQFYQTVLQDDVLSKHFEGMDMEKHFPVMYNFWSHLIFADGSYSGNAFDKHLRLQLSEKDFSQWLKIFHAIVDELFEGEKATLAKQKADSIAWIFESKLKQMGKLS